MLCLTSPSLSTMKKLCCVSCIYVRRTHDSTSRVMKEFRRSSINSPLAAVYASRLHNVKENSRSVRYSGGTMLLPSAAAAARVVSLLRGRYTWTEQRASSPNSPTESTAGVRKREAKGPSPPSSWAWSSLDPQFKISIHHEFLK